MKTIGLIGGMSWQSSVEYYRIINEACNAHLGGFHSSKIMMYSVDFDPILKLQHEGDWQRLSEKMLDAARKLESAGADYLLICANTMHKTAEYVEKNIGIPLVHIADVVGEEITSQGLKKVGLIGTTFTMQQDFYKDRIERYGLTVLTPELAEDQHYIYKVLTEELTFGIINHRSKAKYLEIMQKLIERGAEGIILGCTEIPLLITQQDTPIPLFDTTRLHALAAVKLSL